MLISLKSGEGMQITDAGPLITCDAGQSGIRIIVLSNEKQEEFNFPGLLTNQDILPQLSNVINKVIRNLPIVATVAIGTTGLTKNNTRPDAILEKLDGKASSVYLAHDSVTGFLGSIGLRQGTMTAVGTGVVTLSVSSNSLARVDGWGNLIGDCGSAYWIGRAGLERGMKAYDGRLPQTKLLEILEDNFTHPEEAYIELQGSPDRVSRIAAFAKRVIEFAPFDEPAMNIIRTANEELALSAVTAAHRSGVLSEPSPIFSWAGNVMRAEVMRYEFERQVRRLVPQATFLPPQGEPIDGVALLPRIEPQSPLANEIKVARN